MAVTIEEILAEAAQTGASDVHVTAGAQPMMRVDGKLTPMSYPRLLSEDTLALLISILNETQRRLFEERGVYDMAFDVRQIGRVRVNAYKQHGSVALALRLIGTDIPDAESLGIPEQVMELCGKKKGLALVAGESGSGRTTTLAAVIDRINSAQAVHIITLEDPIEYVHGHKQSIVDQREIGTDCASYADGLREALRQDADVVLVGDMSEAATVDAAITAAEAGCLILSGVHAAGAAEAIAYLLDAFPDGRHEQVRKRLLKALTMVITQEFVPDETGEKRKAVFRITQ